MSYSFFAFMSRMKYIERWALMRNSNPENVSEHSLEVAMISHCLAVISNVRLGNMRNAERAALIGLYHDSTEIITGDMPTPVKYYNEDIKKAFQEVERVAAGNLLQKLPKDLRPAYEGLFLKRDEDQELWKLVKAADKLSALIKCIEEEKAGNNEFSSAKRTIEAAVEQMELKEVEIFKEEFLNPYYDTLDELQKRVSKENDI